MTEEKRARSSMTMTMTIKVEFEGPKMRAEDVEPIINAVSADLAAYFHEKAKRNTGADSQAGSASPSPDNN